MPIMKLQDKRNRSKQQNSFITSKLVLQKGMRNSQELLNPNPSDDDEMNHLTSIYTLSNELDLAKLV